MVMQGWRARLGFLIPPGNPTVEPEMIALAPPGVTVHFSRMVADGPAGTHHGQEERNRSQIEHIDESAALLAMVKPSVMMLAHTATSYTLGRSAEADLLRRLQGHYALPVATAFGSVAAALNRREAPETRRIAVARELDDFVVDVPVSSGGAQAQTTVGVLNLHSAAGSGGCRRRIAQGKGDGCD